ncbi:MAG: Ribonuclease VapC [Chthoniobacter sp.]|jgi:predicted nucleic acid-binding protein|nr:Ribonuclease VapC [Chthoniobacter sp.]
MYLDTAIIIKLLVTEPDSGFFQDALENELLSTSELALTEVRSALLAKERSKLISPPQCDRAWRIFNERVQQKQLLLHPLNSVVLKKAGRILERCHPAVPLRALDAIHTAACDLSQDFPLCTTDRRMRDAAGVLDIPVFPAADAQLA